MKSNSFPHPPHLPCKPGMPCVGEEKKKEKKKSKTIDAGKKPLQENTRPAKPSLPSHTSSGLAVSTLHVLSVSALVSINVCMTCIRALQAPRPPPSPFSLAFEAFSWSASWGSREILRRPRRHPRVLVLHSGGPVLHGSRTALQGGHVTSGTRYADGKSIFCPRYPCAGHDSSDCLGMSVSMLADSRAVSVAAASQTSLACSRFGKDVERSRCPWQGYGILLASQPRTSGTACESGSVIKERVMRKRTTSIIISLPSP